MQLTICFFLHSIATICNMMTTTMTTLLLVKRKKYFFGIELKHLFISACGMPVRADHNHLQRHPTLEIGTQKQQNLRHKQDRCHWAIFAQHFSVAAAVADVVVSVWHCQQIDWKIWFEAPMILTYTHPLSSVVCTTFQIHIKLLKYVLSSSWFV